MRMLLADDDLVGRITLQEMLTPYGVVHVAVNGVEAITAVRHALTAGKPYDLILMDLLMPVMGGQQALSEIRALERKRNGADAPGAKVILVTGLHAKNGAGRVGQKLLQQMQEQSDGHLEKPVAQRALTKLLQKLGLIP